MAEDTNEGSGQHPEQDREPAFTARFISAVEAVARHNVRYHSTGALVASVFIKLAHEALGDKPAVPYEQEAEMAQDLTLAINNPELDAMGLTVVNARQPGFARGPQAESGQHPPGPAGIILAIIQDAERFGQVLQQLDLSPRHLPAVQESLNILLAGSVYLIQAGHDDEALGDPAMSQFGREVAASQLAMFAAVGPTLEERGFTSLLGYRTLLEYEQRHQNGTLEGYLGAKRLHLLDSGFGPHNWQTDSTAEYLTRRWQRAIEYLGSLRNRPVPSPYFQELFPKLRHDFTTARDALAANPTEHDMAFRLHLAIEDIAPLWAQEFPEENAFYLAERTGGD